MVFLNAQQVRRLQDRLTDPYFSDAVTALTASAQQLTTVRVPPAGIAGWNHDYFCPIHHAPLRFDANRPHEHVCTSGGEILTGAIYDASWWRKVNLVLAQGAQAAAILYAGGRHEYLKSARQVLLDTARVYPGYTVHGSIPYNGPGKANCQTLDEAGWIIPLAMAYDLIWDHLTHEDRQTIETDLLQACADFLCDHREQQFHNHQCWIAAAIGVLGSVLDDPGLIHTALFDRWGLIEQLERGVLADGLWCEITPTYHYYAFDALSCFARLNTESARQIRDHPSLAKMPLAGLRLLLPDHSFPLLNDTTPPLNIRDSERGGYGLEQAARRLELAAAWWPDPAVDWALTECYRTHPRASVEALLYGPDAIQPAPCPSFLDEYFHLESSGIVIVRRTHGPVEYVMGKNSPDAGEHDHRDRPGLYIGLANGERFAPDLGTVPYGLPLHYGWFKTTAAHNTVVLNGENQPPPDGYSTAQHSRQDVTLLTMRVEWGAVESVYQNVTYKRQVFLRGSTLTDHFTVTAPRPLQMDYLFHFTMSPGKGFLESLTPTVVALYDRVTDSYAIPAQIRVLHWSDRLSIHLGAFPGEQHFIGRAPDNPFDSRTPLWVLISRITAHSHTFRHCWVFNPDVN